MDLTLMKNHLYVTTNTDDNLILMYASAAEKAIANYLHKDYDETNEAHEQAKFLLVGNWYGNRESVITGTMVTALPFGVSFILDSEMMQVL